MRLPRSATILITSVMTATALAAVQPAAAPNLRHSIVTNAGDSTIVIADPITASPTLNTYHDI